MTVRPQWTDRYKQDWDDAYGRVMTWWRNEETDRPVIFSGQVGKSEAERTMKPVYPKNAEECARFDLDGDVQLHNSRCYLENTRYLAEAVPQVRTGFAATLGLLCVQAGGAVRYAPENGTVWLEEEENLYQRNLPEVAEPCRELAFVLNMIRRNHETFGYDAVLGANPMLDPLTTLSMMRGSNNFLVDLIDRPDDVKRWTARLGEFHRQAVGGYRTARAAVGRREDSNWCGAWAPGDMDAIQCDVCSMLSPEMFREFALPEAEKEAAFYDYTIWHLDGTAEFKHIDDICAIKNLHAIQYVDEKGRDPMEFEHIWERILGYGKSLLFNCNAVYAEGLVKRFGTRGMSFGFTRNDSGLGIEALIEKSFSWKK
jgi:hypothetical protein